MSHKLTPEEIKALENGYKKSAKLNAELAEEGLSADNEALQNCEEYLTSECE
ncbi:MAG: hypothetical protein SOS24_00245 [Clostridia bacterium]|nr:hypothetical protein [Clostridia bacterium]